MTFRWLALSKMLMAVVPALLLCFVIFVLQMRVGYEIALFLLYIIPIAMFSWGLGWKGTISGVVLTVGLWLWSSYLSDVPYSEERFRYYNALIRGIVFLSCGGFVLLFRHTVETHRLRLEAMRAMLNVCHGCGAVQGSDGVWVPFDKLADKDAPNHRQECPSCTLPAGG